MGLDSRRGNLGSSDAPEGPGSGVRHPPNGSAAISASADLDGGSTACLTSFDPAFIGKVLVTGVLGALTVSDITRPQNANVTLFRP
jgi:hypothetical protein